MPPARARVTEAEHYIPPMFKEPPLAKSNLQPNIISKPIAELVQPLDDPDLTIDQFTAPLLPDTVDFQVPKASSQFSNNGSDRPSNGTAASHSSSSYKIDTPPAPVRAAIEEESEELRQAGIEDLAAASHSLPVDSGEFASTDELELDKTLDRTAEVPVLTSPPSPDDGVEEKSVDTSMPAFYLFNTA